MFSEKRNSLHPSTAAYSSLLQITSDYVNITLSYSLLLPITYLLYSLLHITHWYYYMDTSSLLYITSYYCIVYFILLQNLLLHYFLLHIYYIHYFILLTGITT
jgi:hypothetical protein